MSRSFLRRPDGPARAPPGHRLRAGAYMASSRQRDQNRISPIRSRWVCGRGRGAGNGRGGPRLWERGTGRGPRPAACGATTRPGRAPATLPTRAAARLRRSLPPSAAP